MSRRNHFPRCLVLSLVVAVTLLSACGGGGGEKTVTVSMPVISTTPLTDAAEGTAYAYTLAATDPQGGSVSFALTSAPTGASLSGTTISWTPSAAQSRVQNNFVVTAQTRYGGRATQSWSVTPKGTIRISWIDTYWDATGSTDYPGLLRADYAAALVPNPDGSFDVLTGTLVSDGHLEIPNVPAGYFWLRVVPRGSYWTSSSTFDFGTDLIGPRMPPPLTTPVQSTLNFTFTGAEPVHGAWVAFGGPEFPFFSYAAGSSTGTTTITGTTYLTTNFDLAKAKNAFAIEYEPTKFGATDAIIAGPSAMLSNLALVNGATNVITADLSPAPKKSFNLSLRGADWVPLFAHAAPTPPTLQSTHFRYTVDPYLSGRSTPWTHAVDLLRTSSIATSSVLTSQHALPNCPSSYMHFGNGEITLSDAPSITTNQDFGTVESVDVFPSAWNRTFTTCQFASVALPDTGAGGISYIPPAVPLDYFMLANGVSTDLPTAPVGPMISPVQNPKINDLDLFSTTAVSTAAITLKWDKPALGNPTGYSVLVLMDGSSIGAVGYVPMGPFYTAKTSMTFPTGVITAGRKYLFVIGAIADARANVETAPNRSALPHASADLISPLVTIQ